MELGGAGSDLSVHETLRPIAIVREEAIGELVLALAVSQSAASSLSVLK